MRYLDEFESFVTSVCGIYWMSIGGYRLLVNEMSESQKRQILQLKVKSPSNANMEFVDSLPCMYCEGDPNLPGALVLYTCSQKEYKEINRENGSNWGFIGRMCVLTIYQYWEDYFRGEIAIQLGVRRGEIISDIMGDLRLIRHSIIHHGGVALKEVENCKVINWFKEGDEISIDENKFKQIIFIIKKAIHDGNFIKIKNGNTNSQYKINA